MLTLLSLVVLALPAQADPGCLLPDLFAARSGIGPALHAGMLEPPPGIGAKALANQGSASPPPPPAAAKSTYGAGLDEVYETDNFALSWAQGDADEDMARDAGDALEEAWAELVEGDGWALPPSADRYKLWILLDPTVSGTGYTTEYISADYPRGYPVVYLNPDFAWDADFWAHLSVHEFAHTLQYAFRDWSSPDGEAWYWEASAEWAVELALPELDVYVEQAAFYTERPWLRFDSTSDWHHYGMLLLNAHIEEYLTGRGGMLAIWEASGDAAGQRWDVVIEDSIGLSAAEVWAGFAASVANGLLEESAILPDVVVDGDLLDGQAGAVDYLGTDFFEATASGRVESTGTVFLSAPDGEGDAIDVSAGDIVGVTGLELSGPADYSLWWTAGGDDSGDGMADGDGGGSDGVGEQKGACQYVFAQPSIWGLLLLMAAIVRRKS